MFRLQPLEDGPGGVEVFFVVLQDGVRRDHAEGFVFGFDGLDELDDRPIAAVFLRGPLKAGALLDDFEAAAVLRQDEGTLRDPEEIEAAVVNM